MIRLVHIVITVLYAFSIIGMHVDLHWCSGELASLEINSIHQPNCGCDDELESDSCCADAGIYLKVGDDHSFHAAKKEFQAQAVILKSYVAEFKKVVITKNFADTYTTDLPPPDILNRTCCFLI
ncbi:MAG: hypothetical protein WED33_13305 [Bacteroidia bacterium]